MPVILLTARTAEIDRVLGLENWGTFVLQPVDSMTTRLIVRTRGAGHPGLLAFVLAPFNAFVFEPAHFIMERGMLRGIRDRAEGRGKLAELRRMHVEARRCVRHYALEHAVVRGGVLPA